jgi:hypothetical protein
MADEVIVQTQEEVKPEPSFFGNNSWTEELPTLKDGEPANSTVIVDTNNSSAPVTEAKPTEITVPLEWLKKEFEIEDPAILKAEREELKTLKAKPTAEEIKFENNESKQLHELFRAGKGKEAMKIIERQEKVETYSALEVTKETAADIIKLNMELKYPNLKPNQIEFQYRQEYGIPREPVIKDTEDEDEFKQRHDDWKELVSNIEMKTTIAAEMAKPELLAAKVKLVLPEIDKPTSQANEPTEDQLGKIKAAREIFLNKLESDYSKAEGFTTKVKDESVELPVSFKIPDEDKVSIKGRLQNGLDINDYIDKRWFPNGEPNVELIISDIYELENREKVHSGIANNAANERLKEYRKTTSNVSVNGSSNQNTFQPNQNGNSKMSPYSTGAWSEKPPSSLNN